ncbi:conserved hypothetical protein [Sphingomonas sp. AX6]|nr:conserved hypothetical protein [Sphingomonas sp. AX6]
MDVMQHALLAGIGSLVAVAVGSGVAEYRRKNRRNIDRVGIMPWTTVQVIAVIGAAMMALYGFKMGGW